MNYKEILKRTKLDDADVVCLYPYGSRVYGNFHKNSDYDFIIIVKKKLTDQFSDNLINVNFYTIAEHQQRLDDHEISALECHFLAFSDTLKGTRELEEDHGVIQRHYFRFVLDTVKLRHSLSAKSSNSWVKCKKKLTIPQDFDLNIGRKSMFHSFRIIEFGIQIATHGKIVNYASCNDLYKEIMGYYEWTDLFDVFKLRYNALLTEFRKLAAK
jgi:hypothetical protein